MFSSSYPPILPPVLLAFVSPVFWILYASFKNTFAKEIRNSKLIHWNMCEITNSEGSCVDGKPLQIFDIVGSNLNLILKAVVQWRNYVDGSSVEMHDTAKKSCLTRFLDFFHLKNFLPLRFFSTRNFSHLEIFLDSWFLLPRDFSRLKSFTDSKFFSLSNSFWLKTFLALKFFSTKNFSWLKIFLASRSFNFSCPKIFLNSRILDFSRFETFFD